MTPGRHYRGFTLAEVLVALTIGTFISLVAVGALKTVTASSHIVNGASERNAELRFAARMIARDLNNLYRDSDRRSMRLVGASQTEEDAEQPAFLCFYATERTKARPAQPEGEVYEIEYVLRSAAEDEENLTPGLGEPESLTLFRRVWPNPDRNLKPGGILTPIAEGMIAFAVRFYDGTEWATSWPEQSETIPNLVEVTLAMTGQDRNNPLVETFMVGFPRMAAPENNSNEGQDRTGGNGQRPPNGRPQDG